MDYIIVCAIILLGAILTFFSGFGLGTLMLPVFCLFFPPPVAIGATTIVHFANNAFKFGLVYKNIHYATLLHFGLPAFIAAFLGSQLLGVLGEINNFYSYRLMGSNYTVTGLNFIIGILMIFFALLDLSPNFRKKEFPEKYMALGGMLSGFFGGLSGHQGAFRSAFLTKTALSKEQFIGTSNAIALIIDITRIGVYAKTIELASLSDNIGLLSSAVLFAFVGTYAGSKLIQKTTFKSVKFIVSIFLFAIGFLFVAGII